MYFKDQLIKYYNFTEQDWVSTMQYYKPMKLAAKENCNLYQVVVIFDIKSRMTV